MAGDLSLYQEIEKLTESKYEREISDLSSLENEDLIKIQFDELSIAGDATNLIINLPNKSIKTSNSKIKSDSNLPNFKNEQKLLEQEANQTYKINEPTCSISKSNNCVSIDQKNMKQSTELKSGRKYNLRTTIARVIHQIDNQQDLDLSTESITYKPSELNNQMGQHSSSNLLKIDKSKKVSLKKPLKTLFGPVDRPFEIKSGRNLKTLIVPSKKIIGQEVEKLDASNDSKSSDGKIKTNINLIKEVKKPDNVNQLTNKKGCQRVSNNIFIIDGIRIEELNASLIKDKQIGCKNTSEKDESGKLKTPILDDCIILD